MKNKASTQDTATVGNHRETTVEELQTKVQAQEATIKQQVFDMDERTKELDCSAKIRQATDKLDLSMKDVFNGVSEHMIAGWRYPEITVPVITLDGTDYSSIEDRKGLSWCLEAPLESKGKLRGTVRVFYREEKPWSAPFEQNLLNSIAMILRHFIERQEMYLSLVQQQKDLENVVQIAEKRILQQQQDLLELSTPVLSIWKDVLGIPLIGTLDSRRMQDAMEKALTRMSEERTAILIVDITGVPVVDTMVANHLIRMSAAVNLMGGDCIITGISPATAKTIVHLGIDLSAIKTRATLATGLELALTLISDGRGT